MGKTPSEEAINCCSRWQDAFNNGDINGMSKEMHFPHYRISADNSFHIWDSEEGFSRNHTLMMKALDLEGWVKSIVDSTEVLQWDLNKVHIGIKASRINSNNNAYNLFETLWIITKLNNVWGIQFRSSFISNVAEHYEL